MKPRKRGNTTTFFFGNNLRKTLSAVDELNNFGDPFDSDDLNESESDSEDSTTAITVPVGRHPPITGSATQGGYRWSVLGKMGPPPNLSQRMPSHVDPSKKAYFKTPISSFLSFIPIKIFKAIAVYSNQYAHSVMDTEGSNKISGARWKHDINLQEIMIFFGILIKMVLRPLPGKSYTHCWSNKNWHPYTNAMDLRRFQQIRSVLHFNNNSKAVGSKDAVFKVRQSRIANVRVSMLLFTSFANVLLILDAGPAIIKRSQNYFPCLSNSWQ